ncbi:prepilin-type N-terminal cleavage/methylation domain-containing protein [uncultured Vagococcus sp.]|uniref:prepilin-type N-terminal cleavage/methylation domain-containing protein n=1 Tax=uncultured Vagococcus sp. TaxID=189676 RepID=UPI0025890751|nr:prepilin-type N-terminal cleavage/methylation domain-containing protein [uncultured Vagococcus sp.]
MKKMKQIMKDEEGLTLVELLAVVVIMAIIAGIAAVSISRVIQRTREDAQVSNVQQMLASANLYDIQEEKGIPSTGITLDDLHKEGNIKSIAFAETEKITNIKFEKDTKGVISVDLPEGALTAGKEPNKAIKVSEEDSGSLNREKLFRIGSTTESK